MDRGVCQKGLSNLLRYINVSTVSLPKWLEVPNEGYQIGTARIPDLVYVDDLAPVMMVVEAMQWLLNMACAWVNWARIAFNANKCCYFYETYEGGKIAHPDVILTTKWSTTSEGRS